MNKAVKIWIGLLAAVVVVSLLAWALAQERPIRAPAVTGTVTTIYPDRIVVQSIRGESTSVWVTNQTQFTKSIKGAVADIKLNENVTVAGQPTNIVAQQIQVGVQLGMIGKGAASPQPPRVPAAERPRMMARVTGKITKLQPLTITLPDNKTTVTVSLAKDATILKSVKAALKDIKKGDQVMALGQLGADGKFTATMIRVGGIPGPMPRPLPPGSGGYGGMGM